MKKLTLLAAVCFVLNSPNTWAADGGVLEDDSSTADAGSTPPGFFADGGVNPSVSIDATLTITSPSENDTFTSQVVAVSFQVEGCEMSGPSSNPTGCHIHRFLDSQNYSEDGESKVGYYSSDPMSMIIPTSGPHTIKLTLHRNDGTDLPFDPEISDEVLIVLDLPEPEDDGEEDDEDADGDEEEEDGDGVREPEESGCGCDASPGGHPLVTFASVLGLAFVAFRRRRRA